MPDHVHMLLTIPPKYAVAQVVGFLKGKVQYVSPGILVTAERILRERNFGHEDTLCQHAGKMMKK